MRLRAHRWNIARVLVLVCLLSGVPALAAEPTLVLADGGIEFPDGTVQSTAAVSYPAPVPDTGQTTCFDAAGSPIPCAGSGQDGELQAGVAWPTPRFTLNVDGTATDNLTGLVWLQDANCLGGEQWINAPGEVALLNSGSVTCTNYVAGTFDDWRVPNIRELTSLIDYGETGPSLPTGHPFVEVQLDYYWTSSTSVSSAAYGWTIDLDSALVAAAFKGSFYNVWPVRGGQ
jgi:hypothetical protein